MNIDLDALQKETKKHKEEKENRNSNNIYVQMPKEKGTIMIRILPPAEAGKFGPDKGPFFMKSRLHRVNGRNLHCTREPAPEGSRKKLLGECKICSYLRWLYKESEREDITQEESQKLKAIYSQLKVNERYYFNVIQRNVPQEDGTVQDVGPLIFSCGITLYEKIMYGICGDPDIPNDKGKGDVTDLKTGYDFMLIKGIKPGKDKWPDYSKSQFVDESTPLGEPDQIEEWLAELHDLKAIRVTKTQEELDHELKCHLGLRQDAVSEDFDPSEYATDNVPSANESVEVNVTSPELETEATATETTVETKVETSVAVEEEPATTTETKALADDEFMKSLKNIGKKK
jgi:hypothetical protein